LHEVFSDSSTPELGEIDVPAAKQRVEQALVGAAACLEPGGWLVLFDGLEPPGDPHQILRVRFRTKSIFLGKQLWETERLQSYQYFSENVEVRSSRKTLSNSYCNLMVC
jgi:hypothetical protein